MAVSSTYHDRNIEDEVTHEHIAEMIKEGYGQGEIVEEIDDEEDYDD